MSRDEDHFADFDALHDKDATTGTGARSVHVITPDARAVRRGLTWRDRIRGRWLRWRYLPRERRS